MTLGYYVKPLTPIVIPAKAGIQSVSDRADQMAGSMARLGPRLRRDDAGVFA